MLDSIDPTSRVVGPTADVTLHCFGSNFTAQSVIWFADNPEPIVFVSAGEITTIIRGDLFTGPDVVPVFVRTPGATPSDSQSRAFEFTAA